MPNESPLILVADNQPKNLQIIANILSKEDYRLRFADNSKEIINIVEKMPVDLLILDLTSPQLDASEICTTLKEHHKFQHIPIIFLTDKNDASNIIPRVGSGEIDYVVKPFHPTELLTRVGTQIKLLKAHKQLKTLNEQNNELLGIAAHDLKNPLAAIRSMAEVLIMTRTEDPPFRITEDERIQLYNDIQASSRNSLEIISSLLNIQTIESGEMNLNIERTPIREIMFQIIDLNQFHAATKQIKIHFDLEDDMDISVDIPCFREIVDNILSNAVKYSPKGKNIYITAKEDTKNSVTRISIKDEGPGFTANDLENAFGKFKKLSAKPTGGEFSSGLGLSIVKQLVELHKGNVWIESTHGNGCTFTIEFPFKAG